MPHGAKWDGETERRKEPRGNQELAELTNMMRSLLFVVGVNPEDQKSISRARATWQFMEDMRANRIEIIAKATRTTVGMFILALFLLIAKALGFGHFAESLLGR